jgi:hypothetical protein
LCDKILQKKETEWDCSSEFGVKESNPRWCILDLGQMANLKLVDKQGKELVELKLQVLA